MKDYYHTLEIPASASFPEIKKAYFTLVRKFPPERFPEEFMRIREAYEVLIDEKTRQQYDETDSLPEPVKKLVRHGKQALEAGNSEGVVRLLEKVVKAYPGFSVVKNLLGEAYAANGNTGKAVNTFAELVEEEPQNAGFAGKLAHAYLNRGWHKKAAEQYRQALELDQDNLSLWLGLIDCHLQAQDFEAAKEITFHALQVSRRNGWDNLELYYHIIQIDIFMGSVKDLELHISEMKQKAAENEQDKSNVAWFLATLSKKLLRFGMTKQSTITINTACELLPHDQEILEMKEDILKESSTAEELEALENDEFIEDVFADLFALELQKCDCLDCQLNRFHMEMHIVTNIEVMRKSLRKMKVSYPSLYNLRKDFFDLVLNPKKENYLMDRYFKQYDQYRKRYPEHFEDEGEVGEEGDIIVPAEPIRREQPKIGRNEPCPCGSGKKYKKCCGK